MTARELLPCPFCGEVPVFHPQGGNMPGPPGEIMCRNTACEVQPGIGDWSEAGAIDRWNRRSKPESTEPNPFLESLPLTEAAVAAQVGTQGPTAEEVKEACAKVCDAERYRHEEFLDKNMRGDKVAAFHKSVTAHALAQAIRSLDLSKLGGEG